MTSTTTGLPDRYRPLAEVGPEERTDSGVIHCWRARDRILNRDVAVRVHVPGGPPARAWIARALTAGGLATPALAMVYDASEGTGDGGVAYVVNEWIEGRTLAERLEDGPMEERQARTLLRRLAEGVAEAHRVGLAVGGLGPETVVLRPNGLVGLRAVPAATGSVQEDIAALGALLEACLTGHAGPGGPRAIAQPDLAALVRRARSTEPAGRLASAAAMAALLAERPRSGGHASVPVRDRDESDSGWLRRLREHRDAEQAGPARAAAAPPVPAPPAPAAPPVPAPPAPAADGPADRTLAPGTLPPVPATRTAPAAAGSEEDDDREATVLPGVFGTRDDDVDPADAGDHADHADHAGYDDEEDGDEEPRRRSPLARRLLVIGLPLVALAVVVLLAWWVGTNVLSVAGGVDEVPGSTPPASSSAPAEDSAEPSADPGAPYPVGSGAVFDPFGDGESENADEVPLALDGDPDTAWTTLTYRGDPAFGNLKPGVGLLLDLGSAQEVGAVTVTTTTPGIAVEVRTGESPDGDLGSFAVAASGTVDGTADLTLSEPVSTRYVLLWLTSLVPAEDGFAGAVAEVAVLPAA